MATTVTPTSTGPNSVAAIVWHLLALAIFTYAFQSLDSISNISGIDLDSMFGGHYQFLTILGLWISRLGMIFALLNDLLPKVTFIKTTKTLITVAALPIETLISLLYWSVMTINPDLLVPPRKVADPDNPAQFIWETVRIPMTMDLSMHAAPAIFLLVDYLLFSPPFPANIRPTLISASATIAYCAWAELCAFHNGHYPYPLLDVLATPARLTLYVACSVVFVGVLYVVRLLHSQLDQTWNRSWSSLDGQEGRGTVGKVDKKKKR